MKLGLIFSKNNYQVNKSALSLMHILLFLISLSIYNNCATSSAGIATSNVPIVNRKYKVIGPVQGTEAWYTIDVAIFGIPLDVPPIEKVVDRMIRERDADALINIKYWNDRSVILFMTRNRLGISAEAIKFEDEVNKVVQPIKK